MTKIEYALPNKPLLCLETVKGLLLSALNYFNINNFLSFNRQMRYRSNHPAVINGGPVYNVQSNVVVAALSTTTPVSM